MSQIGNYRIVDKLGEGGMGEVFKGVDVMLEREVAIKMLRPELSSREDIVERFRSEAIALGRLNHSNIAAVYSFGEHENQYFMALEFVKGRTLDAVIREVGALPWRDAVRYATSALEGLAHAHHYNIVHRDVKPANIMVTDKDDIKLMDFGIARILEKARLTRTGYLVGTLEYMSPEQIRGEETDARADIYSMGVVLYEMLTGHLPFEKNSDYELIQSHIKQSPAPPRSFIRGLPPQLEKLVLRALEKSPAKRFPDAHAFIRALRPLLETDAADSVVADDNGWKHIIRDYPIALGAGVAVLIGGSAMLFWPGRDETHGAKPRTEPVVKRPSEGEQSEHPLQKPAEQRTVTPKPVVTRPKEEFLPPPVVDEPLEDKIEEEERAAEEERKKQERLKAQKKEQERKRQARLRAQKKEEEERKRQAQLRAQKKEEERKRQAQLRAQRQSTTKKKSEPAPDIGRWAKDFFNAK